MLSPPERPDLQKIAFSYSASSIFSKSGRFIQGNEGYQNWPFVVGPPFRPAFRASSLRGGGPKCLKICSKIHFLSYLPGMLAQTFGQIDPNRSFFTSWGLAGAPVWPEFHRTGLLGCFGVLPSAVLTQTYTHKYTHKPS